MTYEVFVEGYKTSKAYKIKSYEQLKIGSRILVWAGKEERIAYVYKESSGTEELSFLGILDSFIDVERTKLYKWIADFYNNPPSAVFSLSYPTGLERYLTIYVVSASEFTPFQRMKKEEFVEKYSKSKYRKYIEGGLLKLEIEWEMPRVRVRREDSVILAKSLREILKMNLNADELRIVQKIMEEGVASYSELLKEFVNISVFSLERKGVIKRGAKVKRIKLREDQERVVSSISKETNIIFGQTGSGKTEVYIEVMRGKKALYLVPEVSLIPQVVRRIRERIRNVNIGVYHSYMSSARKVEEWLKVVFGKTDVLVGTRSALFVPYRWDVIVVDEAHDESFYQREGVVYDAVEAAKKLAKSYDIPLMMGSATPRIEDLFSGAKVFHIKRVLPPPAVELVDLREEKTRGSFASKVLEEIDRVLKLKKRVMVFVRRKGFGRVVCSRCGYVHICKNCDVAMTFHINSKTFKCHVCGYKEKAFDKCPVCGGELKVVGVGTERVEKQLKKFFPDKVVERVDREILSRPDQIIEVLDRFFRGKIDILVGTKMISKGINVPGVGLMVVVDVDGLLAVPDFSSRLRAFQLLVQTVGRSGREGGGKAIIQHRGMDEELLEYVMRMDIEGFYKTELERRKLFDYPPHKNLIQVLYSSYDKELAEDIIKKVADSIDECEVFGPSEYPIPRIKGKYTYHFIIKTEDVQRCLEKINHSVKVVEKKGWKVYVNPPALYYT